MGSVSKRTLLPLAAVEQAGRRAVPMPGDIQHADHCRTIIAKTVKVFGRLDILVNNAGFEMSRDSLEEASDDEWDRTFATNIPAIFQLCEAALPHMRQDSSIVNTRSVNPNKTPIL
ncbi:MAG TPA: SDR family NAD(P)-dependent oxidoreductase [Sphingomonas sp.]|uniref:SDR family NAD(P)-dependent oxidoreductase n=1 Tax=Sphingomonas sp. TaxID=28214 RepID=UPI002ED7D0F1